MGAPVELRFADFEVSPRSGELRRSGTKVKLQEQPFQILVLLLERRGEIVSREDIRQKLWTADTFVDFDNGLNIAIKKLRIALGDDADAPSYIETLPRRGYRFIAPVTSSHEPAAEARGLVGKKVSHYRVLEVIGGGGMGLVYKAEDLKLGRRVALKFLPEELATDFIALQRFDREARTASSLNHPHICTIYEVEEYEGQPFIVMELLEGETLRDRLAASAGALGLEEMLDIALQVTDGLGAAHERGIIHRDIKPANIFITNKGACKILDFGLAKLVEVPTVEEPGFSPADGEPDLKGRGFSRAVAAPSFEVSDLQPRPGLKAETNDKNDAFNGTPEGVPLQSWSSANSTLTRTGSAMGTAAYMSPEQVRGEKLDARTDIFSFGLVLYEMATSRRAFSGDTAANLHNAILTEAPVPVHELNSALPHKLEEVIDKSLQKDRERRYRSAAEMRADLNTVALDIEPAVALRTPVRRWKLLAAITLLIATAVGGAWYWRSRDTVRLTDQNTIVLAEFANSTGDPVFDGTLRQAMAIQLEQSPFFSVLSDSRVGETLKLMTRPANQRLTGDVAREVCLRNNAKALLSGSIAPVGEHYLLAVKAVNCQTGDSLASAEAEAESRNQVLKALAEIGNQLRRTLGESLASVEKFNQPLEEATTSSLEALQSFTEGRRIGAERGDAAAIPFTKRAVELDPSFAHAYASLGVSYCNLGQVSLGIQNIKKAYTLRDRVNQRERFYIDAQYYALVIGDLRKASQTYTLWIEAYPKDTGIPHNDLSVYLRVLGQWEKAAVEAQQAVHLMHNEYAYSNLAQSYMALNRLDQARAALDEARDHNVDSEILSFARYYLAFLQGDAGLMQQQLAWANGKAEVEDQLLSAQADTEMYRGHLVKGRELSLQAVNSASHAHFSEHSAKWRLEQAMAEVEVGYAAEARRAAAQALALSSGPSARIMAAIALARAGDAVRAGKLADNLDHEFPFDTMLQNYSLPTIRAAIELDKNDPRTAIETLRVAVPYDLADADFGGAFCPNLHPVYVRGLAYLKTGQGQQAAAEFQKILDHPGIGLNFVTAALAHLQLARAQAMMGDKAAARKSYQDFLTLWKDANPDIPIYRQAKAEYARLR
jgi:eukaryotic-like serine/threonine-protein kinase